MAIANPLMLTVRIVNGRNSTSVVHGLLGHFVTARPFDHLEDGEEDLTAAQLLVNCSFYSSKISFSIPSAFIKLIQYLVFISLNLDLFEPVGRS